MMMLGGWIDLPIDWWMGRWINELLCGWMDKKDWRTDGWGVWVDGWMSWRMN